METRIITVRFSTNTDRDDFQVLSNTSLRAFLESRNYNWQGAMIMIDGLTVSAGDLNKSWDELGVTGESVNLSAVVKANNA